MFQFAGLDTVGLGKIGLGIDGVPFVHHLPHLFVTHEYGIEYGHFVEGELVLVQYGHALTRGDIHRSLIGFDLPADDFQKRGFTGPVGADDTVTVTLGETDVHLIEQNPLAIGQRYIIYTDHN